MLTRRALLKLGAYTLAATHLPQMFAAKIPTKKILILGGTGFLGPPVVERALERGHTVTLFNRGKTNSDLFPNAEKIHGDREKGDLGSLTNDRHWDVVIDVWANDPAVVLPVANLLAKRTDYYYFVSSISAYADYSKIGTDETAPTRIERPGYGGNKARSEKALTELLGDRVGICRPCAIMGPRDESLSYHYWLSHLSKDQEFVAPGTGEDAFAQYVDVRDVAKWIVECVEESRPGIYNTVSEPVVFRTFLSESGSGIGGKGKPVWVAGDYLREQHVKTFDNMPYWNPDRPGFARISPAKARSAGFTTRPLKETARDAWTAYQKIVPPTIVYPQKQYGFEWGISPERERDILAGWKSKQAH
ncbi:MAG TPA: NAD-dependent epimerase/dehydratase family protein [Candidatus Udaeobacter sp.]|nr:NAD-dependent epimerase/dehydratase family protein [Candidatus Udaeobacter sp.]